MNNKSSSATRFPKVKGEDGNARRLRIPRMTLKYIEGRLRLARRHEAKFDRLFKGNEFNRYRVIRQNLENYVNNFLNEALRKIKA
jgi:hypothetical protein